MCCSTSQKSKFRKAVNCVEMLQAQCSPLVIGPYFLYPLLIGIFKVKEKHQYTVKVHAMHGSEALYVLNPKVTPYCHIRACLVAWQARRIQ